MKTYWLIPGLALILLGAGCALSKSQTNQEVKATAHVEVKDTAGADDIPAVSAVVTAVPPDLQPIITDPAAPHTVTLNGGEFFFDPASIHAKAGETMTINFGTVTGQHTFTIDELHISKEMVSGGSLTFTVPQTPGRYVYYCSVGPHKTLGMVGTLVVE